MNRQRNCSTEWTTANGLLFRGQVQPSCSFHASASCRKNHDISSKKGECGTTFFAHRRTTLLAPTNKRNFQNCWSPRQAVVKRVSCKSPFRMVESLFLQKYILQPLMSLKLGTLHWSTIGHLPSLYPRPLNKSMM